MMHANIMAITCIGNFILCQTQSTGQVAHDLVCGPRCLQFILRHYGQEADLVDLIRKVQWPDLEQGTSLSALHNELEERGVHSVIVRCPTDSLPDWPHPLIVHFEPVEESTQGLGHFSVVIPNSVTTNSISLWGGQNGPEIVPVPKFARQISGWAILTSPEPIPVDLNVLQKPLVSSKRFLCQFIGVTCLVAGGCLLRLVSRKRSAAFPVSVSEGVGS